jgi:hypothetical protein
MRLNAEMFYLFPIGAGSVEALTGMIVRVTRWFLITAPVVAGIIVLIFGTAGGISTTFGVVLIGIGPIVWLWNWLIRMSFAEDDRASEDNRVTEGDRTSEDDRTRNGDRASEDDRARKPPTPEQQGPKTHSPQQVHHEPAPHHHRRKLTRPPRRRS